ncbi:MAG: prepilin-type N-terminal cleavage/methylation domain-containing protein [Aestuariibacter sp.]|nr:prepilin-type N-terminal cleavage/methylation domain-containing protein [Aestuariibacter sp.]
MLQAKQKGFTLVEIAIVLVIVGLLIGGVLKGQEMITNAKLKRIESDNAGMTAALFSYQDRYLALPGDDIGAGARFDAYNLLAATANGDGDGLIGLGTDWDDAAVAWAAGTGENRKFFSHLRAAGLIAGGAEETNLPINAYGGNIGVQDGSLDISGHVIIFGVINGEIAQILENQLDDGDPDSGKIQATVIADSMDANAANATTDYSSALRYNMAFRM